MRKLLAIAALLFAFPAAAQETAPASPLAKAQLLLHAPQVKQGQPIPAGVLFTMQPGWHIYWQNPGDSGIPTTVMWHLPEGLTANDIQWPLPERIETSGLVNYGYGEKVILPVSLTPARDNISGPVTVHAEWLVCKDICIPESADLAADLPVSSPQAQVLLTNAFEQTPRISQAPAHFAADEKYVTLQVPVAELGLPEGNGIASAEWLPIDDGIILNNAAQQFTVKDGMLILTAERGSAAVPTEWRGVLSLRTHAEEPPIAFTLSAYPDANVAVASMLEAPTSNLPLFVVLVFAFLGGLILNLMPCVLPILSLKALAVAKKSGAEQRAARVQGIAYTIGVIGCFLAIAGVMLALKSAGAAIGWGFQLQQPEVIAGLFFLMLLVSLNLFGLFELPVLFGNHTSDPHSVRGAFLTGALAVLLATPCTAPFMAPALGATLTMPTAPTLLVFAALGLGMAAPFLLISLAPAARRLLPKPGAWMARFKQFLAFPMLATAAWLLWVLSHTGGEAGLIMALAGALLVAWLVWWAHGTPHRGLRKLLLLVAAATVAWAVFMQPGPGGVALDSGMEPYSAERLDALRAEGRPVFVDATADWCLTCKVNERLALKDAGIQQLFAEKKVVLMVADWTRRDAAITEYLAGFGRNGVPLYVYYAPGAEPQVLPQLLTPGSVREAVSRNE